MIDKKTDLLIIIPPARHNLMWPPYGAMYVASALRRKGYNPGILNVDTERIDNAEVLGRIRRTGPRYIGYSGMVATNYKYIKDVSIDIKKAFPDKIQILGGGLSSAAEVILANTPIDIVVRGEGEAIMLDLLECLDSKRALESVRGIYYRKDGRPVFTGRKPLILNLDTLPYPAFDLVEMDRYMPDGIDLVKSFTEEALDRRIFDKRRDRRLLNILTNRGCIGECSFCVRNDPGLRLYSLKYVFDFIEYCMDKFGVGFLSFGDECFAPNKERNWRFIEEFRRRKLNIVFRITGMRVDTVDRDMLRAYKEVGCWMISYGFESGSQKMLNIIDKRVMVEQNIKAALWTREAGIYTPPQLILAMPGETGRTIGETIEFLKSIDLDFKQYKWTYALPIPGSPLYEYAKLSGAIEDEDAYLSSLGGIEGTPVFHVNATDEDDSVVASWPERIKKELDDHYFYRTYGITNPFIRKILHLYKLVELHVRRKDLADVTMLKLKVMLYSVFNMKKKKQVMQKKHVQYKKKKAISIENFIRQLDPSSVNRDMSLKKINERIRNEIYKESV